MYVLAVCTFQDQVQAVRRDRTVSLSQETQKLAHHEETNVLSQVQQADT